MSYARTTLAIVAFATMVSCTVKAPATTPTIARSTFQLHTTEATDTLIRDLAQRYSSLYRQSKLDVNTLSFSSALRRLETGAIDYFVSSNVPANDDIWAAPLAIDGLVIIVNPANVIASLTIHDLRDIFSGRKREWLAFTVEGPVIAPLSYHVGSDVYREFQRMVMGETRVTGNALLMPNFEAMLQRVEADAGAIGYLPQSQLNDRVKALAIDGILPTAGSISEHHYPLRSTIYVIGREAPPPAFFNFFGWVQSEAGQAVVAESFTALP